MSNWETMSQDELEKQYSPSRWSHRMTPDEVVKSHVTALRAGTENAQRISQTQLNIPYGEEEDEKLDMYMPHNFSPNCPLLIYIHGGYWQFLTLSCTVSTYVDSNSNPTLDSKEESGFMAASLVPKGVAVVAVDYSIASKGNMDLMVSQVRASVASIMQRYPSSELYLCGHSAGAHLVAMVLSADWSKYNVTPDIKGAFLLSGIYDIVPIVSTYVNEPLTMTNEVALRNSPMCLLHQLKGSISTDVVIAVAEHDSPEFRRQSKDYYKSLKSMGLRATFEDVPNTDHFNILEKFVDHDYSLTQLLLKMMGKD